MKKFTKFSVIFLLVILIPCLVFAGTKGKITGMVLDKDTGEPLPGVNITVKGTYLGASTDLNGTYFIINVPVGTYELEVSYIGYHTVKIQNVRISADLTTRQNFNLQGTIMELGEVIVVTATRPLIQQDLTASRSITTSDELMAIPFENVEDVTAITAGFVDGQARGGRDGEVLYQIDGVTTMDPMGGTFEANVPEFAIEEISIITGGFSTEYGNAQSGVINMIIKQGGPKYSGNIRYKTSDFGNTSLSDQHLVQNVEFSFGGPEPITNYLFNTYKDKIRFFVAGEWMKDNGRLDNWTTREYSIQSKLTWTPNTENKISFSFLGSWGDFGRWSNLWKRKTNEDRNSLMPQNVDPTSDNYDPDSPLAGWWGNGQIDTEDLNHNGFLDPGEDLNNNGKIDTEDLNHNGKIDVFNMLDALREREEVNENFILNWTYQISSKSFLEAKLSRNRNHMNYNVKENINEDSDGDGHLDLFVNGIDLDGDGDNRHEDLNGNHIWDWKKNGDNTDLYVDNNNNDYIDASEGNPRDQWIHWTEVPFSNTRDNDGFYQYGSGPSYERLRWNYDEKFIYGIKLAYYNQIDNHNEIKAGTEYTYYDIFDFDRDLASGGNVYGQRLHVFPWSAAAFFEDKMEYEGMILNAGVRLDYFAANTEFPADLDDPVEPGEGEVKNLTKTKPNFYISPRFGISHPITTYDVIYFNYGRYFQMPLFFLLYRNLNFDLSGAFPMVGNPNIEPETTTSYEIGLKHQFSDNMKIEIKGFYKDIQGLTDTRQVYYTAANYYTIYQNIDYGNIRGFEVELYQRYSRYWNGRINYTYMIAKGKASSTRQNYDLTWSGDVIPTEENFLDWDQRHTVNANINLRVPSDENLFGTSIFDDIGTNFVYRYGSGLPFSSTARTRIPPINDQRLPETHRLDMVIDKRINLGTNYSLRIFLWANHLEDQWFGKKNIDAQYFNTNIDVSWYEQFNDPKGKYDDPRAYQEGTTWRLGAQFDF